MKIINSHSWALIIYNKFCDKFELSEIIPYSQAKFIRLSNF